MPKRPLWRHLHRRLGLFLGLWLVWLGLTGSLLALAPRLERWSFPHLFLCQPGPATSLQSCQEAIKSAYPNHHLRRLDLGQPLRFELDHGLLVYVDPHTAQILGSLTPDQSWRKQLLSLHEAGESLLPLVGLLSALMLWAGWALQRPNRHAFPPRHLYDFHRALGWLITPALAISLISGVVLVQYKLCDQLLQQFWPLQPAPLPPLPPLPRADLDSLLARAQEIWPHSQVTRIHWKAAASPERPPAWGQETPLPIELRGAAASPERPTAWGQETPLPIELRVRQLGEFHPLGRSFLELDPGQGTVVKLQDALSQSGPLRLLQAIYPIHAGYFPGGELLVLLGVSPLAMWLSGWQLRRRRIKKISDNFRKISSR